MKIAKNVTKLGTELVYDIFAKTKKLQAEGKKIIDLSLGQSAESPPVHVIEATIKALRDGNNGYTVPNGIIECREAVSRNIKSLYNANVSPERILEKMKEEIYRDMTLMGCKSVSELNRSKVVFRK